MTKTTIPFSPFPLPFLLSMGTRFRGLGNSFTDLFPSLERELKQAEITIDKATYGGIMFFMTTFYFVFATLITYIFVQKFSPENIVAVPLLLGVVFAFLVLIQLAFYPKIIVKKKVRSLEQNLVFALRTLLVEIKSGVTLFDAINIVANSNSGEVSAEFKKAVEKIETGTFQTDALEDMGENNPSLFFRRIIWQLVNGLKAGSDVSTIMESLVDDLSKEKSNQVRKYGNSLKLLSLLYMMLGAIIPALGLTFLIILSTFPQIKINETIFWTMLGFIALGQFMYLGIIKSARPTLLGD